jgi:hypothetical protein
VSVRQTPETSSATPRWKTLLPYGVALLSVALAAGIMEVLAWLTGGDTRPALLVAVTVTALYAGWAPGSLALLLTGLLSRDIGVVLAGAALIAVCALFRRSRARPEPATGKLDPEPASDQPFHRVDPVAGPAVFGSEASRAVPSFIEVTTEATWRFHHEQPLDITLPEDEQVEHLYLYSTLAECNDAFARMYGFRAAVDVIGTRLVVFLPPSNAENVAYLRSFIRSGYRLEDAESQEIDRYGNAKYFVNNLVGIFERGQLVGAWGTQRDVTEQRQADGVQAHGSRIPSTRGPSQ